MIGDALGEDAEFEILKHKHRFAMPRYIPNVALSDCWSSVGQITFYHKDGACFFRRKSSCSFPGTVGQMVQADVHHRALAAWQGLDHNVQEVWNLVAQDAEPHRPPFGSGSHISGFNLFVSAYHGFARLGAEQVPQPRVWEEFPSFYIDSFAQASSSEPGDVDISCRLHLADCANVARYRLLGKIRIVEPGKGCHPGMMRTFLAEDVQAAGSGVKICRFAVPTSLAGSTLQLHSRMLLLDSESGYRSQYQK